MKTKSPFIVKQDFISPLLCEELIDVLDFIKPDSDIDGVPLKTIKFNELGGDAIFENLHDIIPEISSHYGIDYVGTERMVFEWYTAGCHGEKPHCENSNFVKQKWLRTKNRDLTGVLFLNDHNDSAPFDEDFEVYGGKLEFPQWHFGFNPQRGTLVLFPSVPHFINNTTKILAGDLYQVRFHIAAEKPLLFQPDDYPGSFVDWFEEMT